MKEKNKRMSYEKPPIINQYDRIEDKVMTIPAIIKHDYSYEFQFGLTQETRQYDKQFLKVKKIGE